MREREMFRCSNYITCRKTTTHKTGLCVECRKTSCNAPGCDKKFYSGGEHDKCDLHRKRALYRQENEWRAVL